MMRPPRVHATPAELGRVPLEQLLSFAREYGLVDAHRTEGDRVELTAGGEVIRLPRRRAATFLGGMLRGRGWYILEEKGGREERGGAAAAREENPGETDEAVEAVLDVLLTYASEEGLLLGFEKEERAGRVALCIQACTMVLPYAEALDVLFDCVQEHACAVQV